MSRFRRRWALLILFWLSANAAALAGPVQVMVELADPPAVDAYAESLAKQGVQPAQSSRIPAAALGTAAVATRQRLDRLDAAHTRVQAAISQSAPEARTLFRARRCFNGVAVQVDSSRVDSLRALPGVKSVRPLPARKMHTSTSVPFIKAPALWQSSALTGKGIKIGIIDSGIDYLHTDFGGPGTGYASNDTTKIGDSAFFPSAKIAGGYDFCGDDYNGYNTPHPDPDPMDWNGHGTHVAGIAAGYGVTSDGTTYNSAYNSGVPFGSMRIGPGVAPEARLYALRVFGKQGSSVLAAEAIEWAVDPNGDGNFADHLDVINMSLGSPFTSPLDADVIAAQNAAKAGVIVVCSAGNDYDNHFAVGGPGVAPAAISVASSFDNETAANADMIASSSSRGPHSPDALKPDLAAPGASITSAACGTGNAAKTMGGTSMASPHAAGMMALLKQLHPTWTVAELKALAMGTALHDLYRNSGQQAPLYPPSRVGSGRIDIEKAAAARVIAFGSSSPELVGLSFGAPEVSVHYGLDKKIKLVNKGAAVTATLSFTDLTSIPGVSFFLPDGNQVSVPANGSVEFKVRLLASASHMKHQRDPSETSSQNGKGRHWLSEATGRVTISLSDGGVLRVPVYAAPRRVASLRTTTREISLAGPLPASLTLQGTALNTGSSYPADEFSLVSPLEWTWKNPESTATLIAGDLLHVGIRRQLAAGDSLGQAWIMFGLAGFGNWTTPNQPHFAVAIDSNRDGKFEYRLYPRGEKNYYDAIVTACDNLNTSVTAYSYPINGVPADDYDSVPFNTSVMTLMVRAADVGVSGTNTTFKYAVQAIDDGSGELTTITPVMTYNASLPAASFAKLAYFGTTGGKIDVSLSAQNARANNLLGLLLLHHHNQASMRAETIAFK